MCECNVGKGSDTGRGNCVDRGSVGMGCMGRGSAEEGSRDCVGRGSTLGTDTCTQALAAAEQLSKLDLVLPFKVIAIFFLIMYNTSDQLEWGIGFRAENASDSGSGLRHSSRRVMSAVKMHENVFAMHSPTHTMLIHIPQHFTYYR